MRSRNLFILWLLLFAALLSAILTSVRLKDFNRMPEDEGISHVTPGVISIFLAGGDRFLTTNLLVIRSIISVGDSVVHYKDKATLHMHAASINVMHEDNYYQAAAALPWNGLVDEGQYVLSKSTRGRFWDPWPAFYQGFSELYFKQNHQQAAALSLLAAERATGNNRMLFKDLAAKWVTSGANYKLALTMVNQLIGATKSPTTKKKLELRALRLNNLIILETLTEGFKAQFGRYPDQLSELVGKGMVETIPEDPWRENYELQKNGRVSIQR